MPYPLGHSGFSRTTYCLSTYKKIPDSIQDEIETKKEGAAGVEPATSRSAVECSTTELYPRTHARHPVANQVYLYFL